MPSAILEQLDTYGPQHCEQLDYAQATDYTRDLTRNHYENFTVVSWLLPKRLRDDFRHVYAFCRWADDLGDETGDPQKSLELLEWWRSELDLCYAGEPRHPVFVALKPTIDRCEIPRKPFDDLIDAFVQDQTMTRYRTWDEVLDYCTRSADPVGRLVLYLCGYRDEQRQRLSDATCTALQLANFWQDVRRDVLERDRVYLPSEIASQHGLSIEQMVQAIKDDAAGKGGMDCKVCAGGSLPSIAISALGKPFESTMCELVARTWPLFKSGRALLPTIAPDVRTDVKLFTLGGEAILNMIQRQHYNTLTHRPKLSKAAKLSLMASALTGKLVSTLMPSGAR